MQKTALQKATNVIKQWREQGPAIYARDVLGASPTNQQFDAGKSLVDKRRVSIRSGHGTGKSAFLSWCIIWFENCFYPAKIPCTAPTSHQLRDVLWSELALWHRKLATRYPELGQEFQWTNERFSLVSAPQESFAVARTSRPEEPEALQGFHSENLLFIIDEASGVDEKVFEVAEGALSTEGAFVIMCSNPTRSSGYFFDSHHKMRDRWACLHWSCIDSDLVSRQYIEDMSKKYGADTDIYRVRVLGDFPQGDVDTIIPLEMLTAAQARDVEPISSFRPVWGLDVARFGTCRTALAKRQANVLLEPVKSWWKRDLMEVTGIIAHEYEETASDKRPAEILVDSIGLGAGVVDRLGELGIPVRGVNVGETASSGQWNRLRDELWWRAREWFDSKEVVIPEDDTLVGQLSTVRYKYLSTGKIQVEGKDEMQKRGVDSPDEADSFILTFAGGLNRVANPRYAARSQRKKPSSWMAR